MPQRADSRQAAVRRFQDVMMELETEADGRAQVLGLDDLKNRLARLDPAENSFAILLRDEETYLQTSAEKDGFIVERRDGDFTHHYHAARAGSRRALRQESWTMPRADRGQDRFSRGEMTAMFSTYFNGSMPQNITWVRMEMADPDALGTKVLIGLRITFWVVVGLLFFGLLLWLKLR